jgi:hypothetical protein
LHGLPKELRSFAAAPVALLNETVAVGATIHLGPISTAAMVPMLCAGFLQPPYANGVIIACRCEHMWICRVPAYTVDRPGVAREGLDNISTSSVPYIDLTIKEKCTTLSSRTEQTTGDCCFPLNYIHPFVKAKK